MGVPSKEELEQALKEAVRMRESSEDPHHLAKAILNLNYRIHLLETVLSKAKLFLHSGLAAEEHSALEVAIKQAERAAEPSGSDRKDFGLE